LNQYTNSIKAHEKGISCLEVQDGKIYTGSFDHTCKIWDLETGKCLAILEEHTETILHMKIIEKKLITSALDQTCKIWDLETHRCLYTFRGSGSIACFDAAKDILVVFFYKAGTTMMYCCQAWNMHSGECLYRFEKKGAITSIKVFDNAFIATCNTSNYKCEMRDLKTGELKENFPSEFAGINCLEIINDLVIFGGQSQWKSWNRKTGEILDSENSFAHFIGVVRVAQNKVFTASYWNNVIKIWDLKTGKYLRTFEITDLKQAAKGIHYLEITEGKFIISDTVSCWIGDFTKTQ